MSVLFVFNCNAQVEIGPNYCWDDSTVGLEHVEMWVYFSLKSGNNIMVLVGFEPAGGLLEGKARKVYTYIYMECRGRAV